MKSDELLRLLSLKEQLEFSIQKGDNEEMEKTLEEMVNSFDREKLKQYLGKEKWAVLDKALKNKNTGEKER